MSVSNEWISRHATSVEHFTQAGRVLGEINADRSENQKALKAQTQEIQEKESESENEKEEKDEQTEEPSESDTT